MVQADGDLLCVTPTAWPWLVARTQIGDVEVSTVFLGLDHQFGEGPPLLFETMIFGGEHDDHCERCSTWEEAEAGHARAVKRRGLTKSAPATVGQAESFRTLQKLNVIE